VCDNHLSMEVQQGPITLFPGQYGPAFLAKDFDFTKGDMIDSCASHTLYVENKEGEVVACARIRFLIDSFMEYECEAHLWAAVEATISISQLNVIWPGMILVWEEEATPLQNLICAMKKSNVLVYVSKNDSAVRRGLLQEGYALDKRFVPEREDDLFVGYGRSPLLDFAFD
jgi:hypothetical protein